LEEVSSKTGVDVASREDKSEAELSGHRISMD
jgi:hypothetical protein